jgi:hypothetical protein
MIPFQNTSENNQMQKLTKKTPKKIHDERPQKGCYKKGKKLTKSKFLLKCKQ